MKAEIAAKAAGPGIPVPGEEKKPPEQSEAPPLRFVKLAENKPLPGTFVRDTPRADYSDLIASIKKDGLMEPVILILSILVDTNHIKARND